MMFRKPIHIAVILLLTLTSALLHAQEAQENVNQAEQYLQAKTDAENNYLDKASKIQQRLLKRLQRKEQKMLIRLAAQDSALYYQYLRQGISYDSIATLSKDSTYLAKIKNRRNGLVDSLKGVQQFIQNQSSKIPTTPGIGAAAGVNLPYTSDINGIQQKLSVQQGIDALIQQKTNSLNGLGSNVKGLQSIQKDVFYAKEKIKNWKKMADDPDDLEEKSLEYLQGTEGFDKYLNTNNDAFGGLGNNASVSDLQSMGYQTKSSVNSMLQEKLGSSMGSVQDQMGKQVADYTQKLGGITGKINEAKNGVNEAKQSVAEAKQTKDQLTHIEKPTFGKNPERGKPFWQRIEKLYNFQTTRSDNVRPAMLVLNASLGYKQSSKLSYGLGIGMSAGLGQDWQNLKLSYEGISAKAFIDWKLIYGFSVQAGYERIFRPANRPYLPDNLDQQNNNTGLPTNPVATSSNIISDAFGGQQQNLYAGIMKRYKINSQWNGTLLIGYNFLWEQEGLRSPWVIQFGIAK